MTTAMIYRGADASEKYELDPDAPVASLRSQLEKSGFIGADSDAVAWRFFVYGSKSTSFSDAILGKEVEGIVPAKGLFGDGGQLYLTNIHTAKKPDLMGIGTDWFFDRHMSCRVTLNQQDESARKRNEGKFDPILLTKVRPTSLNVAGIYDNVVVCEEGSSVSFGISSWGAAGYGYSIAPDAGDPIADRLYIVMGETPNRTSRTSLYRYASDKSQIVVTATGKLDIPGTQSIQYQRVTITTWRVKAYSQGGEVHRSDAGAPVLTAPPVAGMERAIRGGFAAAAASVDFQRGLANASAGVTVVPGDTITPGAPTHGEPSTQEFGSGISDIDEDGPSNPLGQVTLYFFVFKSHEDARKVIQGINAPNPAVWT